LDSANSIYKLLLLQSIQISNLRTQYTSMHIIGVASYVGSLKTNKSSTTLKHKSLYNSASKTMKLQTYPAQLTQNWIMTTLISFLHYITIH